MHANVRVVILQQDFFFLYKVKPFYRKQIQEHIFIQCLEQNQYVVQTFFFFSLYD